MGDKGYNQASANLRSVYAAVIGMRSNPGWLDVNLWRKQELWVRYVMRPVSFW